MKKAIVFPYSKETRHFIDFANLCSFEVCAYISPKIIGMMLPENLNIKHYESFNSAHVQDENLLIIGYTEQLSKLRKVDYLEQALSFAIMNKMDVYAFDDIYCNKYKKYLNLAQEQNLSFFSPQITSKNSNTIKEFSTIPQKPSIMILGTSSNQGKFTLMLTLKEIFDSSAFYIGTEHHSMLFNMDVTFPYGIQAGVKIPIYEYANYLNFKKSTIKDSQKLIISCAQSGLIPQSLNDGINRSYTLASIAFFLGIKPTHVILVFNPYFDDLNFIKKTIKFIHTTSDAKVEYLAFSDKKRSSQNTLYFSPKEIDQIRSYYSSELNIQCLNIKHDDWSLLKQRML